MPIRTQNGRVLLKNGRVSCECCEQVLGQFDFGPIGDCNCETVLCYDPLATPPRPSPESVVLSGETYTNDTPTTERFTFGSSQFQPAASIQRVVLGPDGSTAIGWNNFVSQPSVVRIFGTVGGDVAISHFIGAGSAGQAAAAGFVFPPDIDTTYRINAVIPSESDFPCGICTEPRNGPHAVDFQFVMFPFTYCFITAVSFLNCFPWFRLRVQRVSSFTPP